MNCKGESYGGEKLRITELRNPEQIGRINDENKGNAKRPGQRHLREMAEGPADEQFAVVCRHFLLGQCGVNLCQHGLTAFFWMLRN